MDCRLTSTPWTQVSCDWLILPLTSPVRWSEPLKQLDLALGGILARLDASGELPTKSGALLALRGLTGISTSRILIVGLGSPTQRTVASLERALTAAARSVADKPNVRIAWLIPPAGADIPSSTELVRAATLAAQIGSIGQDLYKSERTRHPFIESQLVLTADTASAEAETLATAVILAEAVNLARELVNRPAAEITPSAFAVRAEQLAKAHGLTCEVWDKTRLIQERMQSLLAVSQGSDQPPRLVKLEHLGAGPNAPKLALVGKGVTFDSGGLSIKPTDGMLTMRCDMAGAATVLATMTAVARLKLPVNVVGLMGLVENMTGGSAFKLGDVLTARNGVTIEVLNTDAEGRLVLADVLSYAVELGVEKIVDLATLTGACVVALGEDVCGAMTNQQDWCDQLLSAAKAVGEDVWQLPMYDLYDELIKGDTADIKNTGGRWGGAITAAKFLERFVAKRPWVHLDIAGPAFASSNKPHREAGATGVMVRTLVRLIENAGATASAR